MDVAIEVVVFQHEVPAIETVFAPVREDVARFPPTVFAGLGEEERAAAAIDAGDLRVRLEHHLSMPEPINRLGVVSLSR
jgi:hypothetical protein